MSSYLSISRYLRILEVSSNFDYELFRDRSDLNSRDDILILIESHTRSFSVLSSFGEEVKDNLWNFPKSFPLQKQVFSALSSNRLTELKFEYCSHVDLIRYTKLWSKNFHFLFTPFIPSFPSPPLPPKKLKWSIKFTFINFELSEAPRAFFKFWPLAILDYFCCKCKGLYFRIWTFYVHLMTKYGRLKISWHKIFGKSFFLF